ncbi:MAG: GIY-YIG nuclease family protein [Pseudomonadota bacterium]
MTRFDFVATYIMANRKNGAIYTGCSSDLPARVGQHKDGIGASLRKHMPARTWFGISALTKCPLP